MCKNWWVSHVFRAPDFGVEWVSRAVWPSRKGQKQKLVGVPRFSAPAKIDGCLTLLGPRFWGRVGVSGRLAFQGGPEAKIGGCLTLFGPRILELRGCLEPFGLPGRAMCKNWWVSRAFRAPVLGWGGFSNVLASTGLASTGLGVSRVLASKGLGCGKIDECLERCGLQRPGVQKNRWVSRAFWPSEAWEAENCVVVS